MDIIKTISQELNIKTWQTEATIKLIDEGNTIPFIARYRNEVKVDSNHRLLPPGLERQLKKENNG